MTIIKSLKVPYLNEDIIEKYNNVIIISVEGLMMKMNALMLCAMSHLLKMALLEIDDFYSDYVITTEFTTEELKQVKDYCTKGLSGAMTESIMTSFGLLRPLSVKLNRQEIWNENQNQNDKNDLKINHSAFEVFESNPDVTNYENSLVQEIIPLKNEILDIKDEPLDEDIDFNFALGYSSDDSLPISNHTKRVGKRGTKRHKTSINDDDDKDWKPENLPQNKKSFIAQVKPSQKTRIEGDENNWKTENAKRSKPGPKPAPKPRPKPVWRTARSLPQNLPWQRSYREWSDNDLELFNKFELPKPLKEYVTKPKDIDSISKKIKKSLNDEKKQFHCSHCQLKFAAKWNLDMHVITYHNEHLRCPYCYTVFFVHDVEAFKKHIFIHLYISKNADYSGKTCVQCNYNYIKLSNLKQHLKLRGPLHNDECTQCPKKFSTFKEYQDHINDQHYGVWKYRCGFENCGELFDDEKKCKQHTRLVHRQQEFKLKEKKPPKPSNELIGICDICGYHYKTKPSYNFHMYTKHISKDLSKKCPHCNQVRPRLSLIKSHIKQVHLETQCSECGKMLSGTDRLRNHMKSAHTAMEDRPHKCETCGKGFHYNNSLLDHMNIHTGAKPYKCKYCPAAFASAGTHAMHQKGHLGIKRKFKK